MPGSIYETLYDIAAEQYGLVTADDAREHGVPMSRLVNMARRGTLERRSHGVYRVHSFPPSPLDLYMEAALWPIGARGVLSHETALDLHGLSDVNPTKIHITLPPHHRPRRNVPKLYVIHHANLEPDEVTAFEGIPIVTPERAIRDSYESHIGPALIRQAIDDAARRGLLSTTRADHLREDLLAPAGVR